jgi:hypothetical protein
MAVPIPGDFDVRQEELDANETFIRDVLGLRIENWARFRYTIHLGLEADHLHSAQPIDECVKEAYRELGKSHYTVVCALGHTCIAMHRVEEALSKHPPLFIDKSMKDFYYHAGRALDNLARLVYIVVAPDCAKARDKYGRLVRHWVDWGSLPRHITDARYACGPEIDEIRNMRNILTHSWDCPTARHGEFGPLWPLAVRTERDYLWFYDEREKMYERYDKWMPITQMIRMDLKALETFLDSIFAMLVEDIVLFEQHNNVEIRV